MIKIIFCICVYMCAEHYSCQRVQQKRIISTNDYFMINWRSDLAFSHYEYRGLLQCLSATTAASNLKLIRDQFLIFLTSLTVQVWERTMVWTLTWRWNLWINMLQNNYYLPTFFLLKKAPKIELHIINRILCFSLVTIPY